MSRAPMCLFVAGSGPSSLVPKFFQRGLCIQKLGYCAIVLQGMTGNTLAGYTANSDPFSPFTFFTATAYCLPDKAKDRSYGANRDTNANFQLTASRGDGLRDIRSWYVGFDPDLSNFISLSCHPFFSSSWTYSSRIIMSVLIIKVEQNGWSLVGKRKTRSQTTAYYESTCVTDVILPFSHFHRTNPSPASREMPDSASISHESASSPDSAVEVHGVESVKPCDLKDDDIIILVIGSTGAGKSTFVEMAVGEPHEAATKVKHTLVPDKTGVHAVRITLKNSTDAETSVVLVDTPGFGDMSMEDYEVLEMIVEWINTGRMRTPEPNEGTLAERRVSGILYLHRVTDIRLTRSIAMPAGLLSKLCGREFYRRIFLTTTMWPNENNPTYTPELAAEFEQLEQELIGDYWEEMIKSGSKARRFNRTQRSALGIICEIVDIERQSTERPEMRLQAEIGSKSKSLWDTDAGAYLHGRDRDQPPPRLFRERDFEQITQISPVSAQELSEEDMVVVVMGPPGSGKSKFIRTVVAGHYDHPDLEKPATSEVSALRISFGVHDSTNLVLVDTPSFSHHQAAVNDLLILEKLALWFKNAGSDARLSGKLRRISGIVYLHPIKEESGWVIRRNLEIFLKLCGKAFFDRVILTTTGWSSEGATDDVQSILREQKLEKEDWQCMTVWGSKVLRFPGTRASAENIINEIVFSERLNQDYLHTHILQIQRELISERKTLPSTEAGQRLRKSLKQVVLDQKREFQEIAKDALGAGDRQSQANLLALSGKIEENERIIQRLKPFSGLLSFDKYSVLIPRKQEPLHRSFEQRSVDSQFTISGIRGFPTLSDLDMRYIHNVYEIGVSDLTANDIIIVVMGPTGTGKSTFIRTVVGDHYAPKNDSGIIAGHYLNSFTSEVQALRITFTGYMRKSLVLVDTPGFDDTCKSDFETLEIISQWLLSAAEATRTKSQTVSGILYLHRITDIRMTGSITKNFEMFQKLCGEDFYSRVILVTTMWPSGNFEDKKMQEELEFREHELNKDYWAPMLSLGSIVHRFTNNLHSAEIIINTLIAVERKGQEQLYAQILSIQQEMLYEQKTLPVTKAGEHVFGALANVIELRSQLMNKLMERLSDPTEQDPEDIARIIEEFKGLRKQKESAEKDIRQMESAKLNILSRKFRGKFKMKGGL
ncbi:hypothetical protein NP233_g9929 [Leucocoprinus birnbaumii]|uniref:AAA+ ATPase domain-containing protein n=1 Tax=Leucocoprinus birnbaumii TaxID=56174 RepID=A0AAD5YSF1_9AGAR|nr:hypothetical protein NP233_g9929 [Leucocoprinus birnbaumii]